MTVNEGNNPVDAFISSNKDASIYSVVFFNDAPPLPDFLQTNNDLDECEIPLDQLPKRKSHFIPKGVTVRWYDNNQVKLCKVILNDVQNNIKTCKLKVLWSNDVITLPQSSVEPVYVPDPFSIPENISDMDTYILQEILSHDNLKWSGTIQKQCTQNMKIILIIAHEIKA